MKIPKLKGNFKKEYLVAIIKTAINLKEEQISKNRYPLTLQQLNEERIYLLSTLEFIENNTNDILEIDFNDFYILYEWSVKHQ